MFLFSLANKLFHFGLIVCLLFLVNCGGDIIAESGQLQSPNYPSIYPNSQVCTWTITAPIGFSVGLNFETFDVRIEKYLSFKRALLLNISLIFQTESCCDFVEIRDGGDESSTKLSRFSGRTKPNNIKSTGNQLFVRFRSDSSVQRRGFSASFTKGRK